MHLRTVVLLSCLTAGVLAPAVGASSTAAPDAGSIGIRLAEAPTNRRDDPRARLYIVDHVEPGTTLSRRIVVGNHTGTRQHVSLYAAGATVADGTFVPSDGHEQSDVSSWTSVSPPSVDLDGGHEGSATVTIVVPGAAPQHEHYGVVWAEVRGPGSGGVEAVNRVGIRIYLSVGTGTEPGSDFVVESLTARRLDDRTPLVTARVRNTGGRALDMSGRLRLSDGPGGLEAGPFPAQLGTTLAVGASEVVTVPLDKRVPDGPWKATMTLRSGTVERAATAVIRFPDAAGAAAPVRARRVRLGSGGAGVVVGVALGLLAVVAAGFSLLLWWRRRRTSGRDEVRR